MIIKHIPNRINPYEYNDYGREPEYIISEDKINVNCYIEGCEEGKKAPTLIYLVEEKEELQTEGVYLYHKENRDYYTFSIGPFREGKIITYAIQMMEDDQLIQTEWYPFEVLRSQEFYAPEEIDQENSNTEDSMTLHCYYKLSQTKKLDLSMEFEKNNISFQVSPVNRSFGDQQKRVDVDHQLKGSTTDLAADLVSKTFEFQGEGYQAKLDTQPFYFRVEDKNNNLLIEYKNDTHFFQTLLNKEYEIQQLTFSMDLRGKAFYGFGEKFDKVNQRGLTPKNCVYEHFTHQQEKTYLPVPYFITEKGYGFYYDTNQMVDFDIKAVGEENNTLTVKASVENYKQEKYKLENYKSEDHKLEIDIPEIDIPESDTPEIDIPESNTSEHQMLQDRVVLLFGSISEMLKQYIQRVGKIMLPPRWAFGPWMSGNGWNTQKETLEQIDQMKKYQIPASVLVLEAWSDEATFYIFNGAEYEPKEGSKALEYKDFSFPEDGKWTNPKEMSEILHANNVKLILWQIPVIKHFEIHEQKQHENDEATALAMGYHVKLADGSPYRITDHWFANSLLLDFNNPEAVKWWFSKREYLINELQVDGFKTDGGEFVYDNRTLFFDGKTGAEMRNLYPNSYVGSYYKFLEQNLGEGNGVNFSRAGYKGAGSFPIHWAGDQKSEFSELRAQIRAGLSAGLSGVFFWGFDIAGFAGDLPSTDLYLRSTAIAIFCPVMQFHSEPRTGQFGDSNRRSDNNDRSPWNMAEVNEDARILEIYRYYANLRMNLLPYIYNEAQNAILEYRPLFCHLCYDYSDDARVYEIEDEYMFGRSLLVAPIIYEGETAREVYLPVGVWYDFFTHKRYEGGQDYHIECELGKIPVFAKEGSLIPLNLSNDNKLGSYVGNSTDQPERLCFMAYGENGECLYKGDLNQNLFLRHLQGKVIEDRDNHKDPIIILTSW